jgi:hypothetical protein
MKSFSKFLEQKAKTEEEKNIQATLKKIPDSHGKLVKDFHVRFEGGNTLHGDDQHVGYVDEEDKEICLASPWNYGREFTFLHEIAHKVYEKLMSNDLKKKWAEIVKKTKNKQKQSPEELFCMAYANHFIKNKIIIHDHPEWHKFIEELPK